MHFTTSYDYDATSAPSSSTLALGTLSDIDYEDGESTQTPFDLNMTSKDVEIEQLISISFSWLSLLVVFYVIVALCVYGAKAKICQCGRDGPPGKQPSRDPAFLHSLTIVTALSVLVYMSIEVPLYWEMPKLYCFYYHRTKIVCTAVGLTTVYFTLWYRVYTVFYSNPLLRKTTSCLARFLNKLTPVLLLLMLSANVSTFMTSPMYRTSPLGCVKVQKTTDARLKWGLLVSTTLLFQLLLLFSLIYPLCVHQRKLGQRGMQGRSIMPLVRRAAITAGVCMVSDAANAIYALKNKQIIVYVRHMVYGGNMLINMFALLVSFADWRERLFPFCITPSRLPGPRGSTTSAKSRRTMRKSTV